MSECVVISFPYYVILINRIKVKSNHSLIDVRKYDVTTYQTQSGF